MIIKITDDIIDLKYKGYSDNELIELFFGGDKVDFIDCDISEDGTVGMTMQHYHKLLALLTVWDKINTYDTSKLTPKQRKQLDKIREDNYFSMCDTAAAEYRYLSSIFD